MMNIRFLRQCATLGLSALTMASFRLVAQGTPPPAPAHPPAAPTSPAASASPAAPGSTGPAPVIQFDNVTFDFGKAEVGEKVHHTYIVTNTGDALLQITNVHPACGCTTAGVQKLDVAPGKTGEIPVQFDTSRYGGGAPIHKTIDVYSNAKNEPRKTLMLTGTVWKPFDVSPATAVISIAADATNAVSTTVKIVNQTDNPVTVSDAVSANKLFTAELKEIKPGKEYQLLITAQPPFASGNSPGTITVHTSLASSPTLSVTVMANVLPAIQVYPSQITLRTSPDHWTTNPPITIQANTTNGLTLSNPKASDIRIQVEIKPSGPKGMYKLLVAFPPGYQIEPGQHPEVTVDSNNPRFPVVKVPITQPPNARPGAAYAANRKKPPVAASAATNTASLAQPNSPQVAGHP